MSDSHSRRWAGQGVLFALMIGTVVMAFQVPHDEATTRKHVEDCVSIDLAGPGIRVRGGCGARDFEPSLRIEASQRYLVQGVEPTRVELRAWLDQYATQGHGPSRVTIWVADAADLWRAQLLGARILALGETICLTAITCLESSKPRVEKVLISHKSGEMQTILMSPHMGSATVVLNADSH